MKYKPTNAKALYISAISDLCFPETEMNAGWEYFQRKNRLSHPPGKFDNAQRFYASERTSAVNNVRSPSRAFPYSEMKAARSAEHCVELFRVESRVLRWLEKAASETYDIVSSRKNFPNKNTAKLQIHEAMPKTTLKQRCN